MADTTEFPARSGSRSAHAMLIRLRFQLATAVAASLITSWLLWHDMLAKPPMPAPPTQRQRNFGMQIGPNLRLALNQRLRSPCVYDKRFDSAIYGLCGEAGVNVYVSWKEVEATGVRRDTHLQVDLSGLTFEHAILRVLSQNPGGAHLACVAQADGLLITSRDDAAKLTSIRLYDVRDLVGGAWAGAARSAFPFMDPGRQLPIFGVPPSPWPSPRDAVPLIRNITSTVDRPSWGSTSAIRYLSGQLIVTQTDQNQRDILLLLNSMRRRRRAFAFAIRAGATALIALVLVLAWHFLSFRARRVRARRRAGLCISCGYDLRASTGRCPECGRPLIGPSACSP